MTERNISTQANGQRRWYVDLNVLPFIRRYEFGRKWWPILTLCAAVFLALLYWSHTVQGPGMKVVSVLCLIMLLVSIVLLLALLIHFPVSTKAATLYRQLRVKGVFLDETGLEITVGQWKQLTIPFNQIKEFYISTVESDEQREYLTLVTEKMGEMRLPFLHLVDALRMPIPGIVEDQGKLYYLFSATERCPLTASNNDLYKALRLRIGSVESAPRLTRLKYECPHCAHVFPIKVRQWKPKNRQILYCDLCSNLVSLDKEGKNYQALMERFRGHRGPHILVGIEKGEVIFKGTTGVEPQEYRFEIIKGDTSQLPQYDSRSPEFRKTLEARLRPCQCGGSFRYSSLPRCVQCGHTLQGLVNGLGYGRYAVIGEETPDAEAWLHSEKLVQ